MGWDCSNVQVFTRGRDANQMREQVITALRDWVLAGEFVEVSASDPTPPDRTIIVSPIGDNEWLSVFDQACDYSEINTLEELTKLLSKAASSLVLGISAEHGVDLRLYQNGVQLDAYTSRYDWYEDWALEELEPDEQAERLELAGHPERWQAVLAEGKTVDDLAAAWHELSLDYDKVADISVVLGLKPEQSMNSYYGFEEEPEEGYTRLAFRSTRPQPVAREVEGLPIFRIGVGTSKVDLAVGDELSGVSLGVANIGGAGKGLELVVWGSACEDGLVEPEAIRLFPPGTFSVVVPGQPPKFEELKLVAGKTVSGEKLYHLTLPNLVLPAATVWDNPAGETGEIYGEALAPFGSAGISALLLGKATAEGTGEIYFGIRPLENETGQAAWKVPVEVRNHKLAQVANVNSLGRSAGFAVKRLETSDNISALIGLGAAPASYWPEVQVTIESWAEIISRYAKAASYHITYFSPENDTDFRSRSSRLKLEQVPTSPQWAELVAKLATSQHFWAMAGSKKQERYPDPPRLASSGFACRTRNPWPLKPDDSPVAYLSLWLDLAGLEEKAVTAVTSLLIELVDRLAKKTEVIQALVNRWEWWPHSPETSNPYEMMVGVSGEMMQSRRAATRFLRGISEEIWLGAELQSKLGEVSTLEEVADVTRVGSTLHFSLKSGTPLSELEKKLVKLLPLP